MSSLSTWEIIKVVNFQQAMFDHRRVCDHHAQNRSYIWSHRQVQMWSVLTKIKWEFQLPEKKILWIECNYVNYIAEYSLNFHAANRQRLHAEKNISVKMAPSSGVLWINLQNQNWSKIKIPTFQFQHSNILNLNWFNIPKSKMQPRQSQGFHGTSRTDLRINSRGSSTDVTRFHWAPAAK